MSAFIIFDYSLEQDILDSRNYISTVGKITEEAKEDE
jgi:hypothetical protein